MIQRYLGNKTSIIEQIQSEINLLCKKGDYVCDIFSGTLAVSINLKSNGYKVISNDINRFSYCFGKSYLINNSIPLIDFGALGIDYKLFIKEAKRKISLLDSNLNGYKFLKKKKHKEAYLNLIVLLTFLESIKENNIDIEYRNNYFFDYYTEEGKKSNFVSRTGSTGNRKFFHPKNGKKLDLFLNKTREWYHKELLPTNLYYLLICIITESVEKISNTQGTYHDFPRNNYDSRALKDFNLRMPKFDSILANVTGHILGNEQDSLEFIKQVPTHKVLYIDPPYNFRQYTSYYFMLNLICDYCEIKDLSKYFSEVKFVRGQNMTKNFTSSFCKNAKFIPSLQSLIKDAKTEWVIMSYFNGRNHNSGKNEKKTGVLNELKLFFNSDLFEPNSLIIKPIERVNYQSYGGHKAKTVNELLYIVKKRKI